MTRTRLRQWLILQLQPLSASPQIEADVILMHVLSISRAALFAWGEKAVGDTDEQQIKEFLSQRMQGKPLAYLTGSCEFWSLKFRTTPDTLIPRPDTELLVQTILEKYHAVDGLTIADLGTGSGAIAIALAHEKPTWKIHATDISDKALRIAQENADRLHCQQVNFHLGDWFQALPTMLFDVIVSNPPYIAQDDAHLKYLTAEPINALISGHEGMDDIIKICSNAKRYLRPSGMLIVEHGYDQGAKVRELFSQTNFSNVITLPDLSGLERVTFGFNTSH